MSDRKRLKAFWHDWNYVPDDRKEFEKLRARLDDILDVTWKSLIAPNEELRRRFAFVSGTPFLKRSSYGVPSYNNTVMSQVLNRGASALLEVMEVVQIMLWTLEGNSQLEALCGILNNIFDVAPNIPAHIVYHEGTAKLRPSGARLLDEAVIDSNLEWLEKYPEALKAFEEALTLYQTKNPAQHRTLLNNLRVAAEHVVQAVLRNKKSLENQKDEFLAWLKQHDAHDHIVAMFRDLLFVRFTNYQNTAVKSHTDSYTRAEVEFILYLTGTFLRYIQQANEQPAATAART